MGIFSRIFGKKKKQEEEPKKHESLQQQEEQKTEVLKKEARNVTLEEVEKELDELDQIQEDHPEANEHTPSKIDEVKTPKVEQNEPVKATTEETEEAPPKTKKKVYHIKPHPDGWQVLGEGNEKPTRVFDYQKDAIAYAKDESLEYLLYKQDGTLRSS